MDLIDYLEQEQMRYRKKAKRSTTKKTKHKHAYDRVLLVRYYGDHDQILSGGKKCRICGHVREEDSRDFFEKLDNGNFRMMENDEIRDLYAGCEEILIEE